MVFGTLKKLRKKLKKTVQKPAKKIQQLALKPVPQSVRNAVKKVGPYTAQFTPRLNGALGYSAADTARTAPALGGQSARKISRDVAAVSAAAVGAGYAVGALPVAGNAAAAESSVVLTSHYETSLAAASATPMVGAAAAPGGSAVVLPPSSGEALPGMAAPMGPSPAPSGNIGPVDTTQFPGNSGSSFSIGGALKDISSIVGNSASLANALKKAQSNITSLFGNSPDGSNGVPGLSESPSDSPGNSTAINPLADQLSAEGPLGMKWSTWLLLGAAGFGAYWFFFRKKS